MRRKPIVIGIAVASAALGCGGDDSTAPVPGGCPDRHDVAGICAGAPRDPLCDGAVCSDSSCKKTVEVTNDGELASALSSASQGTCIALHDGAYGTAALPAGVSLLGRGPSLATL